MRKRSPNYPGTTKPKDLVGKLFQNSQDTNTSMQNIHRGPSAAPGAVAVAPGAANVTSHNDPLTRQLMQGIEHLLDTNDETASATALFGMYNTAKARADARKDSAAAPRLSSAGKR
ncbi:hypothetical protein NFJ02_19g33970 [Pycnococcus provasolii]